MAYLGRGLDKISNIEVLDNITFTNSAGPYNITKSSTAFVPASANALVISIDGVIQSPSSYTLSVATITFDTSMASTSTMNFMYQIGAGVITTPSDGSVGTAQLATDAVTNIKVADDAIGVAELSATGTASASTYLRGDNSWAVVPAEEDKVKVSSDDTTPGYLNGKLVAGTNISLTEGSGGADETLTIANTMTAYNDDALQNDIATLALHQATNNNSIKYNLTNTNVDVYQDSSAITNLTNCLRDTSGEYISTVYTTTGAFSSDSNTILLMHMDNNYDDASSNNISASEWTASGGASFSTSSPKFGTHSLLLVGASSQYVYSSDLNSHDTSVAFPTTGDFTIEHWFKYSVGADPGNTDRIFSMGNDGTSTGTATTPAISYGYQGGSTTNWNTYGDYSANYNWNQTFPTIDADWHQIAYVRKSGTTFSFLDGVQKGNDNFLSGNNMNSTGIIFYGNRSGGGAEYFDGYVDEVRISDIARYDTTQVAGTQVFTPNEITASNATGSYESTAQTANASTTTVSAVITYTNASGTATLNTDLVCQVSADNGSTWQTATLTPAGTFSTGILQAVANDVTCVAGTQIKYKISFANQSSGVKVTRVNGVSLIY